MKLNLSKYEALTLIQLVAKEIINYYTMFSKCDDFINNLVSIKTKLVKGGEK